MLNFVKTGDKELKTIIMQAPMGVCMIDARTHCIDMANAAFLEVAGRSSEEIVGKGYREVFAEAADLYSNQLQKVIDEGIPFYANEVELTLIRHGRKESVWVTFVFMPVKSNDEVVRVVIYVLENTSQVVSRQQIEKEVAERTSELENSRSSLLFANNYLQQLLNLSSAPTQVLLPIYKNGVLADFRYKITNQAYAAYANATPEFLANKMVGEVFPGYFQTSSFVNVVKTFTTGIADTWEIHYNADGLDIYNLMSATKMGEEVVVQFTEITEIKKLQLDLVDKVAKLELSNRNLGEFAHAASHDLKEPIRKVKIFTQRLRDQLAERLLEGEMDTFDRIENAVERMGTLVDDLLIFSEVSDRPFDKEPVDLNKKLELVKEDLGLDMEERKVLITANKLPVIQGYRRQLQQLLQNLISNAIKYTKPDQVPVIHITAGMENISGRDYHTITISDEGIGFEQQYAESIFQLFTRLHGRSEYEGTGIGLSIVRKVVENHEGFVEASSEPGKGASFKVLLPA